MVWHPCKVWLCPKVKVTVKGNSFEPIQDTEAAMTVLLKPLREKDFQKCFRR